MAKVKKQNVFADLDLPNPEQELLKAQLSLQIYRIIKQRGLTQAQAGAVLGIKQPHVSALTRWPRPPVMAADDAAFIGPLGLTRLRNLRIVRHARGLRDPRISPRGHQRRHERG
jgi:hypothetical protein